MRPIPNMDAETRDREFWLEIRRGLLLVLRAIEKRYNIANSK
jgi:hypothetical protein